MFFRVTKKNHMHFFDKKTFSNRTLLPVVCFFSSFLSFKKYITNIGLRYVVEMFILYFQFTTCYGQYLHFKYKRSRKIMSDNK